MNRNTRDALIELCNAVEIIAQSCYMNLGEESATAVINKAETLKNELAHDETIP